MQKHPLYDNNGWENKKLEDQNNIKPEYVTDININSRITEKTKDADGDKLSKMGQEIVQNKVETLGDGSHKLIELEDGSFFTDITKESYYRYTVDWFTLIVTLAIMAFVLVTVGVKLAKLFFELAFNYLLATLVAPADIHSGQKIKQVLQNIINILLVTVMIFMSIKVYLIGTQFIDNHFHGMLYLVAMLGFSMAVIDGPNIVERLFGIDAGLKSGWGAIAGTYAMAKGAGVAGKGLDLDKTAGAVGKGAGKGIAKGATALGSKGMSPIAGLAGQKATNASMNKGKSKDYSQKNGDTNNAKSAKPSKNSLASKGPEIDHKEKDSAKSQASATIEPYENNNPSNGEGRQGGENTPSLIREMKDKESPGEGLPNQDEGKPQSLHDEMNQKGYRSPNKQVKNNKGARTASLANNTSAPSSGNSSSQVPESSIRGSSTLTNGSAPSSNTHDGSSKSLIAGNKSTPSVDTDNIRRDAGNAEHNAPSQVQTIGSNTTMRSPDSAIVSSRSEGSSGQNITMTETTYKSSSPTEGTHSQQVTSGTEYGIKNKEKTRIVEGNASQRQSGSYPVGKKKTSMRKDITKQKKR